MSQEAEEQPNCELNEQGAVQQQPQQEVSPEEQDSFVYEEPTKQETQYRIFISNCDKYVPSQVVEQLRNDHLIELNPNIILGSRSRQSLDQEKQAVAAENHKRDQAREQKRQARAKAQALREQEAKRIEAEEKAQTGQQQEEASGKSAQPQQGQQAVSPQPQVQENDEELQSEDEGVYQPAPFSVPGVSTLIDVTNRRLYNSVLISADIIVFHLEADNIQEFEYILRFLREAQLDSKKQLVCITSFQSWGKRRGAQKPDGPIRVKADQLNLRNYLDFHMKFLEDMCMALHTYNDKLEGSVVFAGMVYGNGEDELFSNFKRALEQEKPLEVYGAGSNHIPMIHVADLCQIAENLIFHSQFNKKRNWHFACDGADLTQKQIVECISNSLGNGQITCKPVEECFLRENYESFTIDVQVQDKAALKSWECFEGFESNISRIVSQFNAYRGLRPNKILIIGPPASGKTTVAQHLNKAYGLPIIQIKTLIQEISEDQSEFAKQIQTILEQIKVERVEEERKLHEEMKKKKKGKGVEEFDPDKVVPRLPQEHLKRVLKWRLSQSDCQNKGYILDGVLKTYDLAEAVFSRAKESTQNQGQIQNSGQIEEQLLPTSVFLINASDDMIKQRVKGLPAEKTQNTHWTEEHTTRRLQIHAKDNEGKSVKQFFEGKVSIKQLDFDYQNAPSILTEFVERDGPLGFKKESSESEQTAAQEGVKEKSEDQNQEEEDEEDEAKESQPQEEFNLENLTEKEQKILNEKSRPIRQYLIDNVIPQITEGLLQICKDTPEDPIDFLIGFLEGKNAKGKKSKK